MKSGAKIWSGIATAGLALLLGGCAAGDYVYGPHPKDQPQRALAPEARPNYTPPPPSKGSLWSAQTVSLWTDDKAFRPGDIVLVRVAQRNNASMKGNTDTKRDSSISAKIKYFLGLQDTINNVNDYDQIQPNISSPDWNPPNLVEASSSSKFSGSGATSRSDTLEATISTLVTDVLPNGNLVIFGNQTIKLSNESSVLTVQGIVRPSDIDVDNTIDSRRIADAHIELKSSGVVNDNQHPGWAQRAFAWIWPF